MSLRRHYFARARIQGKLIVKSLTTKIEFVAELRLTDFIDVERCKAIIGLNADNPEISVELTIDLDHIRNDLGINPRTINYREF